MAQQTWPKLLKSREKVILVKSFVSHQNIRFGLQNNSIKSFSGLIIPIYLLILILIQQLLIYIVEWILCNKLIYLCVCVELFWPTFNGC